MRQRLRKNKDLSNTRQFTRKDVEDCFNQFWGAAFRASGDTVTIKCITWLSNLTPPTWRIEFCLDSPTGFHYHDAILLMQHSWPTFPGHQEFTLMAPHEQALPEGCASVKQEDARLQQQRCTEATQTAPSLNNEEER